ncbi:MAG: tRNA (adenosine(37)-N6)-threonylcarbamoyltransferase complex ATPase subunit type 1 TsaE [Planctomycetota bacterium]
MSTESTDLYSFVSSSPEETFEAARRLGSRLDGGAVLALHGDLGAGKTTFTRGLTKGLGVFEGENVSSPTYVLEQIYAGPQIVRHYDAYRLAGSDELVHLGFLDHVGSEDVIVVEWADRVEEALPPDALSIHFEHDFQGGEESRRIRLTGRSERWADIADRLGSSSEEEDS